MPSLSIWGPPTWTLLHTLATKINENDFNKLLPTLFGFIKRICSFLPCPDCSQHATQFLGKITLDKISTKEDLKSMLYFFHNMVNTRTKKSTFNYTDINKYDKLNIAVVFNNFVSIYNTKGNMKLLSESFQRSLIIKDFKAWLVANINSFK